MNTTTTSLRLLVLLLPDLLRQTPLFSRAPLIAALLKSCSFAAAGSPARPRPVRFACALLASATLWRWYLQIRYLVGLTSAWQLLLRLPLPRAPSSLAPGLVRFCLLARESAQRAATRYLCACEHIVRLYVSLISAPVYLTLPYLRNARIRSKHVFILILFQFQIGHWTLDTRHWIMDTRLTTSRLPSRFPSSCPSRCTTCRRLSIPWKCLATARSKSNSESSSTSKLGGGMVIAGSTGCACNLGSECAFGTGFPAAQHLFGDDELLDGLNKQSSDCCGMLWCWFYWWGMIPRYY
ncbi:hypothetical protein QBC45DRAFT_370202 [Copromyces sp. CBS 386.78]|nr:hypothetical protein QBC45DRAFT_370202 [Copromyces sp. CBS 386.78]